MLKKVLNYLWVIVIVISLPACQDTNTSVDDYEKIIEDSEFYSREDIEAAMDVVIETFKKDYTGCTLKVIAFDEDETFLSGDEYADSYNADECIIITTTFETNDDVSDLGLNKNTTYDDYEWVLVRSNKGKWKIKDRGYD